MNVTAPLIRPPFSGGGGPSRSDGGGGFFPRSAGVPPALFSIAADASATCAQRYSKIRFIRMHGRCPRVLPLEMRLESVWLPFSSRDADRAPCNSLLKFQTQSDPSRHHIGGSAPFLPSHIRYAAITCDGSAHAILSAQHVKWQRAGERRELNEAPITARAEFKPSKANCDLLFLPPPPCGEASESERNAKLERKLERVGVAEASRLSPQACLDLADAFVDKPPVASERASLPSRHLSRHCGRCG